jgi:ABC-2 type transport system permease protein
MADVRSSTAASVAAGARREAAPRAGWMLVAGQELRDLWLAGRGLPLAFAFSVLVAVITWLGTTNEAVNFLEQREAVNLTLQVAVAVGALLALLAAADALSGERERGTLESLLLTPVSRRSLVLGKLAAAISLWFAAYLISIPFIWFLGRKVGAVDEALLAGLGVGTLVALALTAFGIVVSAFSASNRFSLSLSLFVLLALFAPTLLPSGAKQGWAGELLQRINPMTAAEHYMRNVVIDQYDWTKELSWLASPLIAAVALSLIAVLVVPRLLSLRGGVGG